MPYLPERSKLAGLVARAMGRPESARAGRSKARLTSERVAPDRSPDLSEPVDDSALTPLAASASAPPVSFDGAGSLDSRLDLFVSWLVGSTGAFAAFIADAEGLALANRHAPESYVVASASLAEAHGKVSSYVPSSPAGSTTIELHGENVLQVVWVDTSVGRLAVGLVLPAPLERPLVHSLRDALVRTARTKGVA